MKKTLLLLTAVAVVLIASGCTQQNPDNGQPNQPGQPGDFNRFQRTCNTDADCTQPQPNQLPPNMPPTDFNRDRFQNNNPPGNDFNQRMRDRNQMRKPSGFKCVSGYCQPVFGENNVPS